MKYLSSANRFFRHTVSKMGRYIINILVNAVQEDSMYVDFSRVKPRRGPKRVRGRVFLYTRVANEAASKLVR